MCGRMLAGGLVWLVAATAGSGAIFHVDGRDGDDAADGKTAATAWRSLEKVNEVVLEPGDRVRLRAGCRWSGQLCPKGGGRDGAPVVIEAYAGDGAPNGVPLPLVDAAGRYRAALHLHDIEHIEVRGIAVANAGDERQGQRCGVLVDLQELEMARGIVLAGLRVESVNGSLRKRDGGGAAIRIECNGRGGNPRFDGIVVEGCVIRDCARDGITMSDPPRQSGWHPHQGVVIRGNSLEGVAGEGIVTAGCDGAVIEHNRVSACPRILPVGEEGVGILARSCDNTVIQFNEVSGETAPANGQAFGAGPACRGTVIQYNFSHDNDGGFLLVRGDPVEEIRQGNCRIHGSIIRHNLSVNDGLRMGGGGAEPGFAAVISLTGEVAESRMYHNTVIVPTRPDDRMDRTLMAMRSGGGMWPDDTWFANNLVFAATRLGWLGGKARATRLDGNGFYGQFSGLPGGDSVSLPRRGVLAFQDDGAGSLLEVLWQDRNGAARAFAPLPELLGPAGIGAVEGDPGFDFTGAPLRSPLRPGAIQR